MQDERSKINNANHQNNFFTMQGRRVKGSLTPLISMTKVIIILSMSILFIFMKLRFDNTEQEISKKIEYVNTVTSINQSNNYLKIYHNSLN
jgi:hypothetical protein